MQSVLPGEPGGVRTRPRAWGSVSGSPGYRRSSAHKATIKTPVENRAQRNGRAETRSARGCRRAPSRGRGTASTPQNLGPCSGDPEGHGASTPGSWPSAGGPRRSGKPASVDSLHREPLSLRPPGSYEFSCCARPSRSFPSKSVRGPLCATRSRLFLEKRSSAPGGQEPNLSTGATFAELDSQGASGRLKREPITLRSPALPGPSARAAGPRRSRLRAPGADGSWAPPGHCPCHHHAGDGPRMKRLCLGPGLCHLAWSPG